jgi:hypothetical protein
VLLVSTMAAFAGEPGFGLRLSGEVLRDQVISVGYGSGSLSGEALVLLPLTEQLEIGAVFGYRRLGGSLTLDGVQTGESSWLWYAPMQLTLGARIPLNSLSVFGSVGPTLVLWGEEVPSGLADGVGTSGGKVGLAAEVGIGVPLQVQHSLHDPEAGIQALELQIGAGYRHTFRSMSGCLAESPCGLDFSALKATAGLVVRL